MASVVHGHRPIETPAEPAKQPVHAGAVAQWAGGVREAAALVEEHHAKVAGVGARDTGTGEPNRPGNAVKQRVGGAAAEPIRRSGRF